MLPNCVMAEIQKYSDIFDERFDVLVNLMKDLVDGTKKKEITDWWLSHIEESANDFLSDRGYVMDALPYNYLDVPPRDFDAVRGNLKILRDLMTVGGETLDDFLETTTDQVNVVLQRHVQDVKFILNLNWEQMNLGDFSVTQQQRVSLQEDLEYMRQMKQMDDDIRDRRRRGDVDRKKAELSGVVPIAGLIMARFHILECELQSVLLRFKQLVRTATLPGDTSAFSTDSNLAVDDRVSHLAYSAKIFLDGLTEEEKDEISEDSATSSRVVEFALETSEGSMEPLTPKEESRNQSEAETSDDIYASLQSRPVKARRRKHESNYEGSLRFRQYVLETLPQQTHHECIEFILDKKHPSLWTKVPSTNLFRSDSCSSSKLSIAQFRDSTKINSAKDCESLFSDEMQSLVPASSSSSSASPSSLSSSSSSMDPPVCPSLSLSQLESLGEDTFTSPPLLPTVPVVETSSLPSPPLKPQRKKGSD
jgi:hypothetical protein